MVCLDAGEWHVAVVGDDGNVGSREAPLRTIQRAAVLAQPGDTVTVHPGTYREWVNPPRGGTSEQRRIVYQAGEGGEVVIKGSEVVKGWVRERGDVWRVTLPASFFGDCNPFADEIRGDWFDPRGRKHHRGAVYLNGEWLTEAAEVGEVWLPEGRLPGWLADGVNGRGPKGVLNPRLWFAEVDGAGVTTMRARFPGVDPNQELVEVNVRRAVFYPDGPGRNFITVRGFTLRQAATPWAPPTAEQIGLLGTHWSKGWVIEDNTISHSTCTGITLGKHGDRYDNTSADTATGYVETIKRAHAFAIPWTREHIGHHVVRNNRISHCEQAGIVGSLGAAFSVVSGNTIHDIHVRRLFTGAEMAGIKFHGAIDTVIRGNHLHRCCLGLWLDWMSQGTRVSGNLFHDNGDRDLFVEVNHGPFLIDNNVFLSSENLLDMSQGGAYVHNLFAGLFRTHPEMNRETPYHPAHSTDVVALSRVPGGDNRFINNVFVGPPLGEAGGDGWGLRGYGRYEARQMAEGNVYFRGARPLDGEVGVVSGQDPAVALVRDGGVPVVELDFGGQVAGASLVTTARLGKTRVSGLPYVNVDGSPLVIDRDYCGKARDLEHPMPGPLEVPSAGRVRVPLK